MKVMKQEKNVGGCVLYGEGDNSAPLGKKVTLGLRHTVGLGAQLESPAEGAACVKALNQGGGTGSRDAVMLQHHNIQPSPCLASPKDSTLYPGHQPHTPAISLRRLSTRPGFNSAQETAVISQ